MAATTGIINGTDFLMYVSSVAIAHSSNVTLNLTMSTRDTSSKASAGATNRGSGKRDWNVSGDGLYQFDTTANFTTLMGLWTNRTRTLVRVSTETVDNKYYEGYGYLTSLTANFPSEENSTYSFTFEGDGDLTEYTGT